MHAGKSLLLRGSLCLSILLSFSTVTAQVADQLQKKPYKIDTLVQSLDSPWSLAFLPNGDYLITELGGKLRRVKDGKLLEQAINGVPAVYYAGQGGLFDVVVDREFASNQKIYLSFAFGDANGNATRLISARLLDDSLVDIKVLFTAKPLKQTPHHYGGRVVQLSDGTLLLTVGDGFNYREQAQKLNSHLGKIIRINQDGKAPADNPWANDGNALPQIWSIGHRNEQALVLTPNGIVFENEHGPRGGDEINIIRAASNYGWPVITQGIDYNGASITPYTEYAGMQQPLVSWTPSIAPAGMTYYTGSQFPEWQGDLLVVSLAQKSVRRIDLDGESVKTDERLFPELNQRMRDIRTGPDGSIYILSDGANGQLLRISTN